MDSPDRQQALREYRRLVQAARAVLVRNFVDVSRLHFTTTPNGMLISGRLERLPARKELSPRDFARLATELQSAAGGRRIRFELDNWRPGGDGIGWVQA